MNPFPLSWEGRTWVNSGNVVDENRLKEAAGFKVLSYHVFADCKCSNVRYTTAKTWKVRCAIQLDEIKSYDADIICLQDADHYRDWWQPQLMRLGYDSVFKQRTHEAYAHLEGVITAYKREYFQLFQTVEVDFNRAAEQESVLVRQRCYTDDVALITFFQPWPINKLKSAICVANAMLSDCASDATVDVRCYQAQYLAKSIEVANREFHVPVLIASSLHDEPNSAAYHILRTGRSQLVPQAPRKCKPPIAKPFCRGSAKLYWEAPVMSEADPPILQYVISWRPGGNMSLGFRSQKTVDSGDCIQYTNIVDKAGIRRTVALEQRTAHIHGLASATPYEFRVAALNSVGMGEWSEPCAPVVMPRPFKIKQPAPGEYLRDVEGVYELRETLEMQKDDWNSINAYNPSAADPVTNLTPRDMNGMPDTQITVARILPLSTNPREGWKKKLRGEMSDALHREIFDNKRLMKSKVMNHSGYLPSVSDTSFSRVAKFQVEGVDMEDSIGHEDYSQQHHQTNEEESTKNEDDESFRYHKEDFSPNDEVSSQKMYFSASDDDSNCDDSVLPGFAELNISTAVKVEDSKSAEELTLTTSLNEGSSWEIQTVSIWEKHAKAQGSSLPAAGNKARALNDDIILDCREIIDNLGKPNKRQVHALGLRSAYEGYGVGSEPLYTTSKPSEKDFRGISCQDYIFYSGATLTCTKILSIPYLSELEGEDPREDVVASDPYFATPLTHMAPAFQRRETFVTAHCPKQSNPSRNLLDKVKRELKESLEKCDNLDKPSGFWGGEWVPFAIRHERRYHSWLPNESYASSHIALCAHFQLNEDYISSEWR